MNEDKSKPNTSLSESQPKDETKDTSYIPLISSKGECNIPSFFQQDQTIVEKCNKGMAEGLFRTALTINIAFSLVFFKNISPLFILGFLIFHVFLYYFTTKFLVDIGVSEWKTFQSYKKSIKQDPDFSRFDTPLSQFRTVTGYMDDQPLTKRKMIYLILIVSFLFVWFPVMFGNLGNSRFDLSGLRSKLPFGNANRSAPSPSSYTDQKEK